MQTFPEGYSSNEKDKIVFFLGAWVKKMHVYPVRQKSDLVLRYAEQCQIFFHLVSQRDVQISNVFQNKSSQEVLLEKGKVQAMQMEYFRFPWEIRKKGET